MSFGYPTGTWGVGQRGARCTRSSYRNTWGTDVGFEVPAPLWQG